MNVTKRKATMFIVSLSIAFSIGESAGMTDSMQKITGQGVVEPVPVYPQKTWQQFATPEEAGWSSEKLEAARKYSAVIDSAAVMIIYKGAVLAAWGDVERRYNVHSIRKSFLSALYGIQHDAEVIDLNKTLADLQIDDLTHLTNQEKQARVSDLLKARSGVYIPAAYETTRQGKTRPPRGSHPPGTYWYYNNWDFNVLATIFNQETGSDLFEEFDSRLAIPLQMEEFSLTNTYYHFERLVSIHPAYPFRMSAKDMARFGLLYLREGKWNGHQILSKEWIQESIIPYSLDFQGRYKYGYLWWIQATGKLKELGMYFARGYGGHAIAIIPKANLVVVHRTDTYQRKRVSSRQVQNLLNKILQSKLGPPKDNPKLVPLSSTPQNFEVIQLPREQLDRYVGTYVLEDGSHIKITRSDSQLLGQGWRGDKYRLLPLSPLKFILDDQFLPIYFEFNPQGEVEQLKLEFHPTDQRIAIKSDQKTFPQSALWDSVLSRDVPGALSAIDSGADVQGLDIRGHIAGRNGRRPLGFAASLNDTAMIEMLLNAGAEINLTNHFGSTPLHHAGEAGAKEAAILLIEKGAEMSSKNKRNHTPLEAALHRNRSEVVEVIRQMMDRL